MRIFRTMGRLTFGAYLIHPSVIRLSYGSMSHPFFTDDFRVVIIAILCHLADPVFRYFKIFFFFILFYSMTVQCPPL